MRIGFDLRPFLKEETGIGIYFKNLLFHLSEIDQSNEYFLFSSSFKDRFPLQKIPSFANKHFRDFSFPVKIVNFFWYKLSWPSFDYFFRTELDLVHSPTPLTLPTKGKKIVTVHDLFFMDFPKMTDRETRKYFFRKINRALQMADGIIAVSKFTKDQLIEKFNILEEKVKVVYHGLDAKFNVDISPKEADEFRDKFSLPSSFILFVGAIEPRKNLVNLIDALKIIHEKHNKILLVLVGRKGEDYRNVKERIRRNALERWVRLVGYIPEAELRNIYRIASVFAFPSLQEGFGFPLLEAMVSGLPIVASHSPAIPEVAQDAALYFNPCSPEDIAEKVIRALEDKNLRESLISKGKDRAFKFDWKTTAAETLAFYNKIAAQIK